MKKGSLLAHLLSIPSLDLKDKDAVHNARVAYYKAYKKQWQANDKINNRKYLISFTLKEVVFLQQQAKLHGKVSVSRVIKLACLSYFNKKYLPMYPEVLASIAQLLGQNLIALQALINEDQLRFDIGKRTMQLLEDLESKVLGELYNPKEKFHP